jgi:hypothetical protein
VFPIVAARPLARGIKLFEIKAPRIAKKQKPGQFVIVRLDDAGERIPLTIADANPKAGTVSEPDDSGRRSPVTIKGSEFDTPCSVAIIGAGTTANPLIQTSTPGLQVTKRGYIAANDDTLATSEPGVVAGGDIVTGGATVILAMGAGRKAAKSINGYLKSLF